MSPFIQMATVPESSEHLDDSIAAAIGPADDEDAKPVRPRTLSSTDAVLNGIKEYDPPAGKDSPSKGDGDGSAAVSGASRASIDDSDDDDDDDDDDLEASYGPRWLEEAVKCARWARSLAIWIFVVICCGLAVLAVPYDGGQSHRRHGRGGVMRWREALSAARRLGAGAALGRGLAGVVRALGRGVADVSPNVIHAAEALHWLPLEVLMASLAMVLTGMINSPCEAAPSGAGTALLGVGCEIRGRRKDRACRRALPRPPHGQEKVPRDWTSCDFYYITLHYIGKTKAKPRPSRTCGCPSRWSDACG
ncbi:hypothetical protein M885DRAFT_165536 [Pelagophyceae sp. CCMP2097]|nr:hypothetical protein M885DRAFT_165536 [Pelagophyceae sp. CCMP2097]